MRTVQIVESARLFASIMPFYSPNKQLSMKNLTILMVFIMKILNLNAQQKSDTLSLDHAIVIALKNNQPVLDDSSSIAKYETELIAKIFSLYNKCLFFRECHVSIEDTKKYIFRLFSNYDKNEEFILFNQLLLVDLNIKQLVYKPKFLQSKTDLKKALKIDESREYYLSSPFDYIYTEIDSIANLRKGNVAQSQVYNSNIQQAQQLSIKKQLLKHKLHKYSKASSDFTVINEYIQNYITTQIE